MGIGEPFCQGSKILVLIKAETEIVNRCYSYYSKIDDEFEVIFAIGIKQDGWWILSTQDKVLLSNLLDNSSLYLHLS